MRNAPSRSARRETRAKIQPRTVSCLPGFPRGRGKRRPGRARSLFYFGVRVKRISMPDVFTKAKRSEVMSCIRGRGNKATELALARLLRLHHITDWRRSSACFRQTGFRLSQAAAGGLRRWLFLARLSETWNAARPQPRVLAAQVHRQQSPRPARHPAAAAAGLAGVTHLGT